MSEGKPTESEYLECLARLHLESSKPEREGDIAFMKDFRETLKEYAKLLEKDEFLMSGPGEPMRKAMLRVVKRAEELKAQA